MFPFSHSPAKHQLLSPSWSLSFIAPHHLPHYFLSKPFFPLNAFSSTQRPSHSNMLLQSLSLNNVFRLSPYSNCKWNGSKSVHKVTMKTDRVNQRQRQSVCVMVVGKPGVSWNGTILIAFSLRGAGWGHNSSMRSAPLQAAVGASSNEAAFSLRHIIRQPK